jgi:hypothetical protein
MKISTRIALAVFAVPVLAAAMSNMQLNGQNETTVTQYPATVIMTCDLEAPGNRVEAGIYADINSNGVLDREDRNWVWRWGYLTDGIGWFLDPSDLLASVPGDETGKDGSLKVTFPIFRRNAALFPKGTVFVELKDQDGSTAVAKIRMDTPFSPPMVRGQVTNLSTGRPMTGVQVQCRQLIRDGYQVREAYTGGDGGYEIMVEAGDWELQTFIGPGGAPPVRESEFLVVDEGETVVRNLAVADFDAKVKGKVLTSGGLPVDGLIVKADNEAKSRAGSARTDSSGSYEIEIPSGTVAVSIYPWFGNREKWLGNYYPYEREAVLNVPASGEIVLDITLMPFDAFIEGTASMNGLPFPNARIQADFRFFGAFRWDSWAETGSDGKYRVGVPPCTIEALDASSIGYAVAYPSKGWYSELTVSKGQTLSGKDFTFSLLRGGENSIGGLVTGPDGLPAAGAYVAAVEAEAFYTNSFFVSATGPDGRYLFDNVKDGKWRVMAGPGGGTCIPPMIHLALKDGQVHDNADFQLADGSAVEDAGTAKASAFAISANYPNPFNPSTEIRYTLPASKPRYGLKIEVTDMRGRQVKILFDGVQPAGNHSIRWDGTDGLGRLSPSGVYLLKFQMDGFNETRKMALSR